MAEQKSKRVMTLTAKNEIAKFSRNGEETTIWSLDALDAEGNPITGFDLRTFDENIPLGEQREFHVQKYEHEKYGTSYTVTVLREKLGPRVEALEAWVQENGPLVERIVELERKVKELEEPGF